MKNKTIYSDAQIIELIEQQEQNLKSTARRSGYTGKDARDQLERLNAQPIEERISNYRLQLSN